MAFRGRGRTTAPWPATSLTSTSSSAGSVILLVMQPNMWRRRRGRGDPARPASVAAACSTSVRGCNLPNFAVGVHGVDPPNRNSRDRIANGASKVCRSTPNCQLQPSNPNGSGGAAGCSVAAGVSPRFVHHTAYFTQFFTEKTANCSTSCGGFCTVFCSSSGCLRGVARFIRPEAGSSPDARGHR